MQLYVFDECGYIPVVVKNKAAEILFGNIKAESVDSTYKSQTCGQRGNKSTEDQCGQGLNFYSLWLIHQTFNYLTLFFLSSLDNIFFTDN